MIEDLITRLSSNCLNIPRPCLFPPNRWHRFWPRRLFAGHLADFTTNDDSETVENLLYPYCQPIFFRFPSPLLCSSVHSSQAIAFARVSSQPLSSFSSTSLSSSSLIRPSSSGSAALS